MSDQLSDQYSLSQQRTVLVTRRNALLQSNSDAEKEKIEKNFFETLRSFSPLRLKPCLIERNTTQWVAAYLIQRIGQKGYRYLLPSRDWKIVRSRKSAKVVEISSNHSKLFNSLTQCQKDYFFKLDNLLASLNTEKSKQNGKLHKNKRVKQRTK